MLSFSIGFSYFFFPTICNCLFSSSHDRVYLSQFGSSLGFGLRYSVMCQIVAFLSPEFRSTLRIFKMCLGYLIFGCWCRRDGCFFACRKHVAIKNRAVSRGFVGPQILRSFLLFVVHIQNTSKNVEKMKEILAMTYSSCNVIWYVFRFWTQSMIF